MIEFFLNPFFFSSSFFFFFSFFFGFLDFGIFLVEMVGNGDQRVTWYGMQFFLVGCGEVRWTGVRLSERIGVWMVDGA